MAKKHSKNLQKVQDMLDGKGTGKIISGYSTVEETHKVGDRWFDSDGKEWEQKTQNPQSPYDAKNKRLQCIDCGTLFTWDDYEMYNIAIAEFQRHLVSKHNRVKTEIEKDVLLNLSYEGAST